jgi:hypothetical protein
LLDEFFDDAADRRIVQFDPLVDLLLLDGSQKQANRAETRRILGAHGGFHVLSHATLERHG